MTNRQYKWALLVLAIVLMAGCGGGGSGVADRIIGTWILTGVSNSLNGQRVDPATGGFSSSIEFSGSTFQMVFSAPGRTISGPGTWSRIGDSYIMTDQAQDQATAYWRNGEIYMIWPSTLPGDYGTPYWYWYNRY